VLNNSSLANSYRQNLNDSTFSTSRNNALASQQQPVRQGYYHNGLPQRLPPLPRTTSVTLSITSEDKTSSSPTTTANTSDLAHTLLPDLSSYLNRLKTQPEIIQSMAPPAIPIPQMDEWFNDPIADLDFMETPALDTSPLFGTRDSFDVEDTPLMPTPHNLDIDQPGLFTMGDVSPNLYDFTPELFDRHSFDANPVIDPSLMGHADKDSASLFGSLGLFQQGPSSVAPSAVHTQPATSTPDPSSSSAKAKADKAKFNGSRPSAKLLAVGEPIQARTYITPSTTSRKDVPAAFQAMAASRRKRAASEMEGEEEEGLEDDLKRKIETKRRQNTEAARRSRNRKKEYKEQLEDEVESLRQQVTIWQTKYEELFATINHSQS
jgi:hypothetical protein